MAGVRSFKNAAYAHLAEVGKALSSPARLEILELLAQAPRTVDVLAKEIEQSVANTSHHLRTLKRAQLVRSERDGLHVVYSLISEDAAALLTQLQVVAGRHVAALEKLSREFFEARDDLAPVDRDTLLELLRDDAVMLVDVRPEHEFEAGHLPNAVSMPLDTIESRLTELPRDRRIVAYCRGPYCALSADAAQRLRKHGFDALRTDVSVHVVGASR